MKTESKSRDNVFVTVSIAVQYRVVPEDMYDAFYKLQSPISHIQLYIHSVVRSTIPTLSLDELFNAKDSIAVSVQKGVEQEFFDNGYHVVQVLVEDIIPDTGVRDAINEISAQDRLKVANVAKADAEKIVRVMEAEAYGESQHLSGLGLARSRRAIMDGVRDSIVGLSGVSIINGREQATKLLLMNQYLDGLKTVAENSEESFLFVGANPLSINNIAQEIMDYIYPPDSIVTIAPKGLKPE
eukprot:TRINITY_DN9421_c0_g1_i9.p1 TRINITY_DN9421_c0_g1~~TRINITY_DN9421_c0_g1_i9.p1  ORF type:complete len:241 (+),score=46.83 TRINITY_DN9421_c0_g1_i9:697-1419(+)